MVVPAGKLAAEQQGVVAVPREPSAGVLFLEPLRPLSFACRDWLSWLRLDRLLLECELPRLGVGVLGRAVVVVGCAEDTAAR